jgi:hypothetical protein
LRPPTVALRARKPCRRLRTRLLGWKVRFIAHPRNLEKQRAATGTALLHAPIGKMGIQVNQARASARRPSDLADSTSG